MTKKEVMIKCGSTSFDDVEVEIIECGKMKFSKKLQAWVCNVIYLEDGKYYLAKAYQIGRQLLHMSGLLFDKPVDLCSAYYYLNRIK